MRKSPRHRNDQPPPSYNTNRRQQQHDREEEANTNATSSFATTTEETTGNATTTTDNIGMAIESEGYGDVHKIVLQGIMSAGYLDAKGVKKLFIGACTYLKLSSEGRTTMRYVQQVVREINDRIRTYDMAIKSASCELTGKKYYIFLITVEKPIMKLQTLFSPFEIALFQKCMEKILRKYNNFSVPLQECIDMGSEIDEPKASNELAKTFIESMIEFNYFTKYPSLPDGESNVTLGIRTIREFEPILRQLYHDVIANCSLCNMILLHGYLCPSCKLLVHKPCYSRYISTSTNCPNCKISWAKEKDMIRRVREAVEQEVEFDFSADNPSPSSQNTELPQTPITDLSSVETHITEDDDDLEVPMPILEPMIQLKIKEKKKKKNKSKKKKSRRILSSEEEEEESE